MQCFEVSVCIDCHMAAAGLDSRQVGYDLSGTWDLWVDRPGRPVAHDGEEFFSTNPCEGCGSVDAGDRFDDLWFE